MRPVPSIRRPPRTGVGRARILPAVVVALCTALIGLRGPAPAWAADPYAAEVVQTTGDLSQRLVRQPDAEFGPLSAAARLPVIHVDAGIRYQSIAGFGAAMTDTSAWLLQRRLTAATRAQIGEQLFGRQGIGLNFVRIPMGASDFTHDGVPYTYDDVPGNRADPALHHFSIAHDRAYVLPALRQALAVNPRIAFLASPWSAPAWMKTNHALANPGNRGTLLPAAYMPWARYFVRFLAAYGAAGVHVGALTVQNEPLTSTLYPGMSFPAVAEAGWVAHDLGPALAAAHLHPQIFGGDLGWGPDNNAFMTTSIFGPAARWLTGISWHCYYGAPGVMNEFAAADPRLEQIVDECSPGGTSPTPTSEVVISSLRDWASTVSLWNLALDTHGGPVQAPNHGCPGCVGLVSVDERTGRVGLTRAYYQLGQVSAFVARGARRIAANHFVTYRYPHKGVNVVSPGLDDVALRNPDGSIVLIVYDNATTPIRFALSWRGRGLIESLTPQTMMTIVFDRR